MDGRRVICLADRAQCEGSAAETEAWITQHLATTPHLDYEPVSFHVSYVARRFSSLIQGEPVLRRTSH
ncbi:hypothetical protein [Antribacter gilvus]|uniref:hypothetical protein n=1 Tax=Antribacter gilvus TaxID=2304675 RepID=UPI000F7B7D57|nr:hypothetical protein [Antribacter gilvus]